MDLEFLTRLKGGKTFECPCCDRYAKLYRVQIGRVIAQQLKELLLLGGDERPVHINEISDSIGQKIGKTFHHSGGAFSVTKYWGLTSKPEKDKSDTKRRISGLWYITPEGADFVRGKTSIKKYALVFDNRNFGFEGQDLFFADCLKEDFDYRELMQR